MEDEVSPGGGVEQKFVVSVSWSAQSDLRLTEGDLAESIEELVMDMDEEATVDVVEVLDHED